jgi:hypothetical protein
MRTKTHLLTAAVIAVGIGASQAQVYSVNAVGYVNKTFANGGLALVANPLNGTNNLINTVLPNVPPDTQMFKWNGAGYNDAEFFVDASTGWFNGQGEPSTTVLAPGEGFFLQFPPGSGSVTVTFVGEVPQGSLSNNIPAGFSIKSSQVPQEAGLSAMGFPADPDDTVFFWNYGGQGWRDAIQYAGGGQWVDTGSGELVDPAPQVAEGFFVQKQAQSAWTRTFSVN